MAPSPEAKATAALTTPAPLDGTTWEFHATSTDGLATRTSYATIGQVDLKGTPAYLVGALLWEKDELREAQVLFVSVKDLQTLDMEGKSLHSGGMTADAAVRDEGGESVTVPAGTFQAQKKTLATPDEQVVTWEAAEAIRPVKTQVTRAGQSMTEEMVRTQKSDRQALEKSYLETLLAMLQAPDPHPRVQAVTTLAVLARFARQDEILQRLREALSDPDATVRDVAQRAMDFVEGKGPAAKADIKGAPLMHPGSAPPAQEPVTLAAISLVADAFGIAAGVASILPGGETEVVIRQPPDCPSITTTLDVGDVVSRFPMEVDFSLGFARQWGLWGPLINVGSNILLVTYQYELKVRTDKQIIEAFEAVGKDGIHIPVQIKRDVLWAHSWKDSEKPTLDMVTIHGTTRSVYRGAHRPVGALGIIPVDIGYAAEAVCTLTFDVLNPFYSLPQEFTPSKVDHFHHKNTEHQASFVLKKAEGINLEPAKWPRGWTIEPLDEKDGSGNWGFQWRLACADPRTGGPDFNCRDHTISGTVTSGDTRAGRRHEVPVEVTYTLRGRSNSHHQQAETTPPCILTEQGIHPHEIDCRLAIGLFVSAYGQNRMGYWQVSNLLGGPRRTETRLPVIQTVRDRDTGDSQPPMVSAITAQHADPTSTYAIQVQDPDSDEVTITWRAFPGCGGFTPPIYTPPFAWDREGVLIREVLKGQGQVEGEAKLTWNRTAGTRPCGSGRLQDFISTGVVVRVEDEAWIVDCNYSGAEPGPGRPCNGPIAKPQIGGPALPP